MSIHLHWYLPTNGDSRKIVGSGDRSQDQLYAVADAFRDASPEYLEVLARSVEQLGFEAVLTPTGTWCEDAWIATAALSRVTQRLKFLVAFRPGLISPTLAAHQAATFQRTSKGRLLLNVVTGGDSVEQRRFGDHLDHDKRYERTDEFLSILRGVSSVDLDDTFSFTGEHFHIENARIELGGFAPPPIFFGGASPAAERVAARQADIYLLWGETPDQVAERLDRMTALAAEHDRRLRFGIRLHVISRDSSEQAWDEAERLLADLTPERIAAVQVQLSASESVGQRRMSALHRGDRESLEISPNLWAGYGLVRGGAGTALVGSHEEVAARIVEYHALGIEHFILSGQPHLEEAYWFAEGAGAVLRDRGLLAH